ncbi:hypothetical protein FB451DRAFT_792379 [Mycena latifolia]|nr:hypothetical protein FB451DRAFT_792379 [Mycena latifolia]
MRFAFSTLLLAAASLAAAKPMPAGPVALDVWAPRVTSPAAGAVWASKSQQNITWDASGAPATISNEALLFLRKGDATAPFILAKDFDLRAGFLEITVPYVLSGSDYVFVVFGDSGNFSPVFTIQSDTFA